jgi:predicted acetyltransferase
MVYRQRMGWTEGLPTGTTEIEELVGVDARAEASLWRYASRVDLFPRVSWDNAPGDCLLPHLVADRRRVVHRRCDTLWLRPDDIAATLSARRYSDDGALRLGVEGRTYLLEDGRCTPSDAAPELTMDRATLGGIFLGGVRPTLLARAGRIAGDPAAIVRAERLFAWPVSPWCQEMF